MLGERSIGWNVARLARPNDSEQACTANIAISAIKAPPASLLPKLLTAKSNLDFSCVQDDGRYVIELKDAVRVSNRAGSSTSNQRINTAEIRQQQKGKAINQSITTNKRLSAVSLTVDIQSCFYVKHHDGCKLLRRWTRLRLNLFATRTFSVPHLSNFDVLARFHRGKKDVAWSIIAGAKESGV